MKPLFLVGEITSPGFPNDYDNGLELFWHIELYSELFVKINFVQFNIEPSGSSGQW